MIQLTAIIVGQHATMLTPEPIAEAARSCRDRFGARFEGFAPIPVEIVSKAKWAQYRRGDVSRKELKLWISEQENEQEIRRIFNRFIDSKK